MIATLLLPMLALHAAAPGEERRFVFTSVDRLRVQGPFTVEVVSGSPGAVATGDPGALDSLQVRAEGGTLTINTGAGGWERRTRADPGTVHIRVSTPRLRAASANGGAAVRIGAMRAARVDLALQGTGSLEVDDIRADELVATHTGFGTMTLAGTAERARLRGFGAARVAAAAFAAEDAVIVWESPEPLTIGVRYTAQVIATGTGQVTILGRPDCRVSGGGPVECGRSRGR